MRLLIVEDNDHMRRLITSLVQDLAEAIHECRDGSQALAAYAEHHPDWVLMDIKMEGMDGITAMRKIKASYPEARIVIVTAYDDAELRVAAQHAGACGYVLKEGLLEVRGILTGQSRAAQ
jgi:CheY-like chemotaxis protein